MEFLTEVHFHLTGIFLQVKNCSEENKNVYLTCLEIGTPTGQQTCHTHLMNFIHYEEFGGVLGNKSLAWNCT